MPKVVLTASRYIPDLGLVEASPEFPAVIEVKEKWIHKDPTKDPDMKLCETDNVEGEKLGKHFADGPKHHTMSAAQVHSEPIKTEVKGKRFQDKSPI